MRLRNVSVCACLMIFSLRRLRSAFSETGGLDIFHAPALKSSPRTVASTLAVDSVAFCVIALGNSLRRPLIRRRNRPGFSGVCSLTASWTNTVLAAFDSASTTSEAEVEVSLSTEAESRCETGAINELHFSTRAKHSKSCAARINTKRSSSEQL
jgi:hypothetical protein